MARGTFSGTQRFGVTMPLSTLADCAFHCWVRIDTTQSANNRIWQLGSSVAMGFQSGSSTTVQVVDEAIAWRGSGFTLTGGVWTPLGLARGGSGAWQFYANGVLHENTTAAPQALSGQLTLGNDVGAVSSLNGWLGPFSVWSNALTTAEFARLAKGASPLQIQPAALQLHIPMYGQGGVGGGEPDYSGHQRPGNQVGNPSVPGFHPPTVSPFPQ